MVLGYLFSLGGFKLFVIPLRIQSPYILGAQLPVNKKLPSFVLILSSNHTMSVFLTKQKNMIKTISIMSSSREAL